MQLIGQLASFINSTKSRLGWDPITTNTVESDQGRHLRLTFGLFTHMNHICMHMCATLHEHSCVNCTHKHMQKKKINLLKTFYFRPLPSSMSGGFSGLQGECSPLHAWAPRNICLQAFALPSFLSINVWVFYNGICPLKGPQICFVFSGP